MYGLDLFSGIGGITKALEGYVTPVAYCENDRYAQAVLCSRMATGDLPPAPIWDDVRTLRADMLPAVDIIYGGFPCQDISVAGRGVGLAGKRSGLFFEIMRLADDIRPPFIFLENVPAIRKRGGSVVVGELAGRGYDCRWITLSASDVGANHRRERWWLLAHARHGGGGDLGAPEAGKDAPQERSGDHDAIGGSGEQSEDVADTESRARLWKAQGKTRHSPFGGQDVAHAKSWKDIQRGSRGLGKKTKGRKSLDTTARDGGQNVSYPESERLEGRTQSETSWTTFGKPPSSHQSAGWWELEPDVGRVAHGVPLRVDRLRGLGNAVVPAQAREAFERLMGLKTLT